MLPDKFSIKVGNYFECALVQKEMQKLGYDWQNEWYKGKTCFLDSEVLLFESDIMGMFRDIDDGFHQDGYVEVDVTDILDFDYWCNVDSFTLSEEPVDGAKMNIKVSCNKEENSEENMEETFEENSEENSEENPKLAIGNVALPMTLLSPLTIATGCLGKLNGKLKYGGSNYIGTKVIMSTYMDAIARHFAKIQLGEDVDSVDGVPHWGAIIANIDIILSAKAAGTLIDDRLRSDGQLEAIKELVPLVKSLQELHKDKNPKHYFLSKNDFSLKHHVNEFGSHIHYMKDSYD
jgi:hypothetical protein